MNALIWYPILLLLLEGLLVAPLAPGVRDVLGALPVGAVLDRLMRRVPWLEPAPNGLMSASVVP